MSPIVVAVLLQCPFVPVPALLNRLCWLVFRDGVRQRHLLCITSLSFLNEDHVITLGADSMCFIVPAVTGSGTCACAMRTHPAPPMWCTLVVLGWCCVTVRWCVTS